MGKTRCDTCTKQQSCTIDMFKCTKEDYSPNEETRARQASKTRFGGVTQITKARRLRSGQSALLAELT